VLRKDYRLRWGDFGSPVLVARAEGRGPENPVAQLNVVEDGAAGGVIVAVLPGVDGLEKNSRRDFAAAAGGDFAGLGAAMLPAGVDPVFDVAGELGENLVGFGEAFEGFAELGLLEAGPGALDVFELAELLVAPRDQSSAGSAPLTAIILVPHRPILRAKTDATLLTCRAVANPCMAKFEFIHGGKRS
jgi:hypothetical protein